MAFTKSTVATNNISTLPDKPLITAAALKQKFDQYGADDKTYVNSLIDQLEATTGTSGAENIGSKTIVGVAGNTPHAQITDVKTQLDARNAENVKLTVDQTIAGIKTFSSSPIVPEATAPTQVPQKKYVDDENLKDVHLTGDQTVAGVKTFLSSPIVPTPTGATQASNKGYIDTIAANFVLGAVSDDSITNAKLATDIKVGSLASLATVVKSDAVSAINEVNGIANSASFKNKIINGNFSINQEVVSGTVILGAGVYGHDMWKAGSGGCTYTFSTTLNVTTITISAGSLIQIVEGVNLVSGTYILSWNGTSQGKIGAGSYSASGVTGVAVGGVNIAIEFNSGTLSNVQFEYGTVVTSVERRLKGVELDLCKRYFRKSYDLTQAPGTASTDRGLITLYSSASVPNGQFYGTISFDVQMVSIPIVKIYSFSGNLNKVSDSTGIELAANSGLAIRIGENSAGVYNNSGGSLTVANAGVMFHYTADARL